MKDFIRLRFVSVGLEMDNPNLCFSSLTIIPADRPTPRIMLEHPWLLNSMEAKLNMAKWIRAVWGWED